MTKAGATQAPKPAPEKSPLERTADLMRRVIAVPKAKITQTQGKKRRHGG